VTSDELLSAYRQGALSADEVLQQMRALKRGDAAGQRIPLSKGQRGLWWLQQAHPASTAYNIPLCFRLEHAVDPAALECALAQAVAQHPLLGCVVAEQAGVPAFVRGKSALQVEVEDARRVSDADLLPHLRTRVKTPFSLEHGPLLRAHLLSRDEGQVLLIVVHHLVIDGHSASPLLDTFFAALQVSIDGQPLPPVQPGASFAEFVAWEEAFLAGDAAVRQRRYWQQQLQGPLPVLDLPKAEHSAGDADIEVLTWAVPAELQSRLRAFSLSQGLRPSVVFLGVLQLLLHRYTHEADIVVGMPTTGRPDERFEDVVGYFVNTVAVRSVFLPDEDFAAFLRGLQLHVADVLDHAAYPFPLLVNDLKISRPNRRPSLYHVESV